MDGVALAACGLALGGAAWGLLQGRRREQAFDRRLNGLSLREAELRTELAASVERRFGEALEPLVASQAALGVAHAQGSIGADARVAGLEAALSSLEARLTAQDAAVADLQARADAAAQTLKDCLDWLGLSHEPRLNEIEAHLRVASSRQVANAGALDQLIARSWRAQALALDAAAAPDEPSRAASRAAAQAELLALTSQRKAAKRRGALPLGETGAVDGIRISRGHRPILVIAFSGMREQYGWMVRLESLGVSVIHLCDSQDRWYLDGCDGSGGIEQTLAALREAVAGVEHDRRVVLGVSMGGYAALRYGPLLEPDLILAFAPQTHRAQTTTLPGVLLQPPEGIVDVRPALIESGVRVEILVSADEGPGKYLWDDHAQLAGLEAAANVRVHVVDCHQHAVGLHLAATGKLDAVLEGAFSIAAGEAPTIDLDSL